MQYSLCFCQIILQCTQCRYSVVTFVNTFTKKGKTPPNALLSLRLYAQKTHPIFVRSKCHDIPFVSVCSTIDLYVRSNLYGYSRVNAYLHCDRLRYISRMRWETIDLVTDSHEFAVCVLKHIASESSLQMAASEAIPANGDKQVGVTRFQINICSGNRSL